MRTILLHYFCQPPYRTSEPYSPYDYFYGLRKKYPFIPRIKEAVEDKRYLEAYIKDSSLTEKSFVTDGEYSANLRRFLHCGAELLVEHEYYKEDYFFKYVAKVLRVESLDDFKIIAADHGLSVEVRSVLELYKLVQEKMEKELREELAKKVEDKS